MSFFADLGTAVFAIWAFGVALTVIAWVRGAITLYLYHWDGFLSVWSESETWLERAILVGAGPFALPHFASLRKEVLAHV